MPALKIIYPWTQSQLGGDTRKEAYFSTADESMTKQICTVLLKNTKIQVIRHLILLIKIAFIFVVLFHFIELSLLSFLISLSLFTASQK